MSPAFLPQLYGAWNARIPPDRAFLFAAAAETATRFDPPRRMTLRLATWNVNSLRKRLAHLERFVAEARPDVLCLQETKVSDEDFPHEAVAALGYPEVVIHGQKGYNGVAILSRRALKTRENRVWCGRDDRRHLCVHLADGLEVHNFYVPSGGPTPDPAANDKFAHKLDFLGEMAAWVAESGVARRDAVLLGDLNVAPLETDVWNHKRLLRSVGHTPVESERMAALHAAGALIDVGRHFVPADRPLYTWWGYRFPQSYQRDYGWRLDHVLAAPQLAGALAAFRVWRETRTWEQPSDHVPVTLDLA